MALTAFCVVLSLAGLLPAAMSDAGTREIPDEANIPILAAAAVRLIWQCGNTERLSTLLFTLGLFILFVIITLRDFGSMGGGDMKLLLSLSLAFGIAASCVGLLISCVSALLYGRLRSMKRLAMAPFFLAGFTVSGALQIMGALR